MTDRLGMSIAPVIEEMQHLLEAVIRRVGDVSVYARMKPADRISPTQLKLSLAEAHMDLGRVQMRLVDIIEMVEITTGMLEHGVTGEGDPDE